MSHYFGQSSVPQLPHSFRWKALASLLLIYSSLLTGWYWPWGVLLAWWVGLDLRDGETWLTESVERNKDPVMYWVIVLTWMLLAGFVVVAAFSGETFDA